MAVPLKPTNAFTLERNRTRVTNVGKCFLMAVPLKNTNTFTLEKNRTGVTNVGKLLHSLVTLKPTSAFTLHRFERFSEHSSLFPAASSPCSDSCVVIFSLTTYLDHQNLPSGSLPITRRRTSHKPLKILKENSGLFQLDLFPINVSVVTLWVMLTLHSAPLL